MTPARSRAATAGFAVGLLALAAVAAILGLVVGEASLSDPRLADTVLRLRAYRVVVAFGAGAALAVGGVLVQGLFRNPLASPSILGTTAGASVGGQAALIGAELTAGAGTAVVAPEMMLPLGCMVGALGALALLLTIARLGDDTIVILLAGFLISAICVSVGALLTSLSQERWELGRAIVAFTLGGVGGSGPRQAALVWALLLPGAIAAWTWRRHLDVMLSGEEEAEALGVDTRQVRRWVVVWTAVLTAGAVAVGGAIAFVGLVVPHVCRLATGVRHARLLPAAAVLGGAFVVLCDVAARAAPVRSEMPLGVVTGLVGAPMFLALLVRGRREVLGA